MSILDPVTTTLADIVNEALVLSGKLGVGQVALAEDFNRGWAYLQLMLNQWDQDKQKVYHLRELSLVSTGADTYSLGPGGDFDTNVSGPSTSVRPSKVQAAFVRQIITSQPQQPDWWLTILNAWEDYAAIRMKKLSTLSQYLFYDPSWPLGTIHTYPVLQADLYELHLLILEQLPFKFATQADTFNIPYQYYWAMIMNVAFTLRQRYGIMTFPGDKLESMAKSSLNSIKETSTAIPALKMPGALAFGGYRYNIFSDQ